MEKPITVLTGLDYWLDNLMCNVPELAMCFHVDGVVQVSTMCLKYDYLYMDCMCSHLLHPQRYETVKTEDIPNLQSSQFSPKARDLLSACALWDKNISSVICWWR